MVSANWQRIGGVEVCEGTDGFVGVLTAQDLFIYDKDCLLDERLSRAHWGHVSKVKEQFEIRHCQPRHRLIECADGAVMVLSTDEVDGKPRRGAFVSAGKHVWVSFKGLNAKWYEDRDEAIAAAVAYVTAR